MNKTSKPARRWSSFTKRAVVLMLLVLLGLTLYRFRNVIPPLMIAFLLAFILNPIVGFRERGLGVGGLLFRNNERSGLPFAYVVYYLEESLLPVIVGGKYEGYGHY